VTESLTTVSHCVSCGAENLGTRFCETCGVAHAQVAPQLESAVAAEAAGATASGAAPAVEPVQVGAPSVDPAVPFRVLALLSYLVGILVVGSLEIAMNAGSVPYEAVIAAEIVISVVVGFFMLLAAAVGRAPSAGIAVGILLAIAYPGATALSIFILGPTSTSDVAYVAQAVIPPAVLFLCWGAGRPFRGGGYAGILVLVVVSILRSNVSPVLANTPLMYEAMWMLASAIGLVVVVQSSLGFDGARLGSPRTNVAARASLILVLSTFLLNSVAGSLGAAGIAAIVMVIAMLLLAIVLGHVGYITAGRRCERGRGLAVTALLLGYLVATATIAVAIWFLSIAAAFSSIG
jgi:hypothetical protein